MKSELRRYPALVLHRSPWSESSWILRLLVPDLGIVNVIAKGARRRQSPFASRLDSLNFVDVSISWRPGRDMQILTGVQLLENFPAILPHPHAQALIYFWIELIIAFQIHGEAATELFKDILNALRFINKDPPQALAKEGLLSLRFLARLAEWEGFALNLNSCAICHLNLNGNDVAFFHPQNGAFACISCSPTQEAGAHALWTALKGKGLLLEAWGSAEDLLLDYLCTHSPRWPGLKARAYLLRLRSSQLSENSHAKTQ